MNMQEKYTQHMEVHRCDIKAIMYHQCPLENICHSVQYFTLKFLKIITMSYLHEDNHISNVYVNFLISTLLSNFSHDRTDYELSYFIIFHDEL